jgi:integrase
MHVSTRKPRVPKYRHHKPTNQAVVTLNGKDYYLGRWKSAASHAEYERLVGEWLAGGRYLPAADAGVTVAELGRAYWKFAEGYYPATSLYRVKVAVRELRVVYGYTLASDFGPLSFQAIQRRWAESGKCRRTVNYLCEQVKRVFKWGVSQELIPETVYRALTTVPGLRRGHTTAPEPKPVMPVDDKTVVATLPHVPAVVADMIRFQKLTGCRPGEVCILRPCDVDTAGDVWIYRPESHKTQYRGRERIIFIGPKGQDVLRPYLLRDKTAYCFVPAESERKRSALRRANRESPMTPSQAKRHRKRNPLRTAGDRYTPNTYRRAIERACEIAFGLSESLRVIPRKLLKPERLERRRMAAAWRKEHCWAPNQLRHSTATAIRKDHGLEAVQVVLGHAHARVSEVYAERNMTLAAEVMRKLG